METFTEGRFMIRVYGLLINNSAQILLSDEYWYNQRMTKFPGGGLQFGEGPEDCIKREALEELGQDVEITGHYYTTGFYQNALFFENTQLLSIYYTIKLLEKPRFRLSSKPFDLDEKSITPQSFRWEYLKNMHDDSLTFPIDRHVLHLIQKEFEGKTV
jgi:ADP-ribose pyrophosphatase YjhB (NUDIX family)